MLRGNGGQAIFFEEEARSHLYGLIQQAVERYGHRVHGFCCMSNHIQVVMQVQDIPLSQLSIVVAYGVGETDLRGPARTRVLSEVRRMIGWLARYFWTATTQEVATYFHLDASTFSRPIGKIDVGERGPVGGKSQLSKYITAFTQA